MQWVECCILLKRQVAELYNNCSTVKKSTFYRQEAYAAQTKSWREMQYTDQLVLHGSSNQQTCFSNTRVLVMSVRLLLTISALIKMVSPDTKHLLLTVKVALIVPALQQQHDTCVSLSR